MPDLSRSVASSEGRASGQECQDFLKALLHSRPSLTVMEAWQAGYEAGLYEGGDAPLVKRDLGVVGRRHDGFWRAMTPAERKRAKRWADYWTAR